MSVVRKLLNRPEIKFLYWFLEIIFEEKKIKTRKKIKRGNQKIFEERFSLDIKMKIYANLL